MPIGSKDAKSGNSVTAVFRVFSNGVSTSRDQWAYNPSKSTIVKNMKKHIQYCNKQDWSRPVIDPKQAKWDTELSRKLTKFGKQAFSESKIRIALYRPFFKQFLYFDNIFNPRQGIVPKAFPNDDSENLGICVSDKGKTDIFSALITDITPDLHLIEQSQYFPLHVYNEFHVSERERREHEQKSQNLVIIVPYKYTGESSVFITNITPDLELIHHGQCFPFYYYKEGVFGGHGSENITDFTLEQYRKHYKDQKIAKKDIFYYVYGLLHHEGYKKKFANNLTKELPRIPMAPNFWKFSNAGETLAWLHLNYETCPKYDIKPKTEKFGGFEKISFSKTKNKVGKLTPDKTKLVINRTVVFENLPQTNYKVGGRTPIEWVVDRYRKTVDKDSGIVNDPTKDMSEQEIISMIQRFTYVSVESDKIIKTLSEEEFEPRNWEPERSGLSAFS